MNLKRAVNKILGIAGHRILTRSEIGRLESDSSSARDLNTIKTLNCLNDYELIKRLAESKAQLRQDLFVLSTLSFKRGGFFVEFGATDGTNLSNTLLLEKGYGWKGILAEPARCWHEELRRNRKCSIETMCVWSESGKRMKFNETRASELSTLVAFSEGDRHRRKRRGGVVYEVETISLEDMLVKHSAPSEIDYLSIDTEGSEYDILRRLNFSRYDIKVITCEHNYTDAREKIYDLLTGLGYRRVFEEISRFDDWYVK